MKTVKRTKAFDKNYNVRIRGKASLEKEFKEAVDIFLINRKEVYSHSLKGSMIELQAFYS